MLNRILARKAKEIKMDKIEAEADAVVRSLAKFPTYTHRAERAVGKNLLLRDLIMWDGAIFKVKVKNVGCGVVEISRIDRF